MAESDSYFKPVPSSVDVSDLEVPPFYKSLDEVAGFEVVPGLRLKPVSGANVMMSFVFFEPNTVAPIHAHSEEQMGTVIEGECEFELNGVRRMLRRGETYCAPPGVPHGARTYGTSCIALDVFSPPRGAFSELEKAAREGHKE